MLRPDLGERIERIALATALEFTIIDRKSRISLSCQSCHRDPVSRRGSRLTSMWRCCRRNKTHLFEPEGVDCLFRQAQVRKVNGVERTPEEADGGRCFQ